ncbi:hypothetical protein K388_05557 [Streptomyces sp. KhCrAH-43]|uniref:hypothetical protein n=1 Tax=unclassified Streptomyces TaxID=2593676 RepID=UPI000382BC7B|nr:MULTISPECIES: hypothetical protein [unclassified Streptomyces]MYX67385.1 hypothetical protein [Streptomyces sp. SID8373]RAJ53770.1 hypothetical protein K388_05557 [Streptomyces sp. KhCrAH-43]
MIDTAKLLEVARGELISLWSDLDEARRDAYENQWSMGCDSLVERIKALTPLVGPTPWAQVQIPLLEDGVYQRVHQELGIEVAVDMDAVAEHQAWLDRQAVTT